MHVPLRLWKDGNSTDVRLHQTTNPQTFELNEKPDSIQFDPDLWLVSKGATVTSNVELSNKQLKLYPNPVADVLHISLTNKVKIEQVKIIDFKGRNVLFQTNGDLDVNVNQLATGSYFIRIRTNKGNCQQQFVKVK